MKKAKLTWPKRPALILALALSIPAFYLILTGPDAMYRHAGSFLYAVAGLLMALDIMMHRRVMRHVRSVGIKSALDAVILFGMLASAWPTDLPWPFIEWVLRLGFCAMVFSRIAILISELMAPRHLLQILGISTALMAIAGAGFYWLEPKVLTYADGLWLAFITGATVGYGDLVPSTPASRIFAVFLSYRSVMRSFRWSRQALQRFLWAKTRSALKKNCMQIFGLCGKRSLLCIRRYIALP